MIRFRMKTVLLDRFLNRENRRQRFVFDDDFIRRSVTRFLRLAHNQRNNLSVIENFLIREQNFVMPNRADIV